MQPKLVLPLALFITLFLTACTATPHTAAGKSAKAGPTPVPGNFHAGMNADITSYATKIKTAIEKEMYSPSLYKGQVCTLRMSLARDGSVSNVTTESGDPELCDAALMAVKQAKIPPAPDEKTWQILKNAPLDFRP